MAEARKIFPIDTFVTCLKGEGKEAYTESTLELLNYMTQKEVDEEFAPFASALTKAWIYEQHPDLTQMNTTQVSELGQNVSVSPLPAMAQAEAAEVFEKLRAYRKSLQEKDAKIAELEAELADRDKKIDGLQKKIKEFEAEKKDEAEKLFVTSEKRIEEYTKKLEELLKEVDEVKKTGVVVAGVAGGAAPAGAGDAASGPADEGAGSDFGFGGGAADPFASEDW
jgi:superfamily II RNA helicase